MNLLLWACLLETALKYSKKKAINIIFLSFRLFNVNTKIKGIFSRLRNIN